MYLNGLVTITQITWSNHSKCPTHIPYALYKFPNRYHLITEIPNLAMEKCWQCWTRNMEMGLCNSYCIIEIRYGFGSARGIYAQYLSWRGAREVVSNIWTGIAQLQGKYEWIFILAHINKAIMMQMKWKFVQCIQNLQTNVSNLLQSIESVNIVAKKVHNLLTVHLLFFNIKMVADARV